MSMDQIKAKGTIVGSSNELFIEPHNFAEQYVPFRVHVRYGTMYIVPYVPLPFTPLVRNLTYSQNERLHRGLAVDI